MKFLEAQNPKLTEIKNKNDLESYALCWKLSNQEICNKKYTKVNKYFRTKHLLSSSKA